MRTLFLVIFFLPGIACTAQLLDSVASFLQEERQLVAKLDMRNSFVRNRNVSIFGAKVGFEHAGRFQYGIGYSMLLTPVERTRSLEGIGEVGTRLRMGYVSAYVDYAFYQRGRWEIRLPVQIGIGRGSVTYLDALGERQVLERSTLIIYEPAMTVQYRLFRYLGIGGGWGFRLAIHTSSDLGENLTAPIHTLGLRVFFAEIWKDLKGPE
jgi:hypothetical protein